MYGIKLYDYVPKPDPAYSGRTVAAHYYPSWTKNENTLNHEFADLSAFPERTPLMGYYEDINPEVIDWEIKWALEHGINCWIYCWYRRKENLGKPVTTSNLRLGRGLHEGLFNARYCNMMKFAIMFETQFRWAAADHDDLIQNVLPFWIENYFSRENYLKIDNKPVVFMYDAQYCLRNSLGGDEGMKEALDECRVIAKKHGFDGILFASQKIGNEVSEIDVFKERGVDAVFAYDGSGCRGDGCTDQETVYRNQMKMNLQFLAHDPNGFIPTVGQFFDPEPRYSSMPSIDYGPSFYYSHFSTYRRMLRAVKSLCDNAPENTLSHKIMMVDNLNEWDEGHFLLPSYRFGFKYMQCIREELTDHENLPDYRMPAQLGFGPYDESWGGSSIDLSAHNDRKLDAGEFTHYRA